MIYFIYRNSIGETVLGRYKHMQTQNNIAGGCEALSKYMYMYI